MRQLWLLAGTFVFCASAHLPTGILGEDGNNVLLVNSTGLKVTRVKIDERSYEDIESHANKILVNVTPRHHHLELFFRGGAHVDWHDFDFRGVHKIVFTLDGSQVVANPQ